MKNIIQNINKAFDHRIRLGIMSVLMVNELEADEFIAVEKQFIGKKPNTKYSITPIGKKAFQDHIAALEKLLHQK